jgi:hypothetical protein
MHFWRFVASLALTVGICLAQTFFASPAGLESPAATPGTDNCSIFGDGAGPSLTTGLNLYVNGQASSGVLADF